MLEDEACIFLSLHVPSLLELLQEGGRRIQSAFSTCAGVIREKWIIVVRALSPSPPLSLSHAMLGQIGSTRRVFTHIRVREEKKKVSFKPEQKKNFQHEITQQEQAKTVRHSYNF